MRLQLLAFFLFSVMASSESESADTLRSTSPSPCSPSPIRALGHPKKSPVWDFFTYDSEKNRSLCQVGASSSGDEPGSSKTSCDHPVTGKFPTNLKNHLKKHHPTEYAEVLQK